MRDINDLIDHLRGGGDGVDCYAATRGDVRLAAAALAAYMRQLPIALLCEPQILSLFAALDVDDYALRIAAIRDTISELPEAHQAVLHRLFYFLRRLSGQGGAGNAPGNEAPSLGQFWANMLMPQAANRARSLRVKEYRITALLLQQSHCIFEGSLETHELPELPLPVHLVEEEEAAEAARKQWVKTKASLLRDSKGRFLISLLEDRGGIHFGRIERSDVHDDREKLQPHDYLCTINRKNADELSLSAVKDIIKHAGSILEVEIRRYAPTDAEEDRRRQEEEKRAREEEQLRRYREQMQQFVAKPMTSTGGIDGGTPVAGTEAFDGQNHAQASGRQPPSVPRTAPPRRNSGSGGAAARTACQLGALPSAPSVAPQAGGFHPSTNPNGFGGGRGSSNPSTNPNGFGGGGSANGFGGGGGHGGAPPGGSPNGGSAVDDLLGLDLLTGDTPPPAQPPQSFSANGFGADFGNGSDAHSFFPPPSTADPFGATGGGFGSVAPPASMRPPTLSTGGGGRAAAAGGKPGGKPLSPDLFTPTPPTSHPGSGATSHATSPSGGSYGSRPSHTSPASAQGISPSASAPTPTLQLHLTTDVKALGRSSAMRAFCMRLTQELSKSLSVPSSRIDIVDTALMPEAGAIVVDFIMQPPPAPSGGPPSHAVRRMLERMIVENAFARHPMLRAINTRKGLGEAAASSEPSPVTHGVSAGVHHASRAPSSVATSRASSGAASPRTTAAASSFAAGGFAAGGPEGGGFGGGGFGSSAADFGAPAAGSWVAFEGGGAGGTTPPPVASLPIDEGLFGGGAGGAGGTSSYGASGEGGRPAPGTTPPPRTMPPGPVPPPRSSVSPHADTPPTEAPKPAVEDVRDRMSDLRGLSTEEKRERIRLKLEQQRKDKRDAADKEKKRTEEAAKAARDAKAATEEADKTRRLAEKKAREEEYRAAVRARIAAEKKEEEERKRREAEERERAKLEAEIDAMVDAGLEDSDGAGGSLAVLEEALALADAHSYRSASVGQARARLKALQEADMKRKAELTRATAALEAACTLTDHHLLKETLATAEKAGVEAALMARAEERLAVLEEEARVRAEEEARARKAAEAKARRVAEATERMRVAADAAEDEEDLEDAIDAATELGADRHPIWMAQQVLSRMQEVRVQREEELAAAELLLEEALSAEDADELSAAIAGGVEVGVAEGVLAEARTQLVRLQAERRAAAEEAARTALAEAVEGEDEDVIQLAVDAMVEVGLGESAEVVQAKERSAELAAAREAREEERRAAAGELAQLMASKLTETSALQAAVARAEAAGVASDELASAQERLFEVEEEEAMRLEEEEAARAEEEEAARAIEEAKAAAEEAERLAAEEAEAAKREEEERAKLEAEEEAERARIEEEEVRRLAEAEAEREAATEELKALLEAPEEEAVLEVLQVRTRPPHEPISLARATTS